MADSARDRTSPNVRAELARHQIAANVRAELARRSKTQRDLAALLGIPQSAVWQRLSRIRAFKAEEIAAMSAWLGIDPNVLLAGAVPAVEDVAA